MSDAFDISFRAVAQSDLAFSWSLFNEASFRNQGFFSRPRLNLFMSFFAESAMAREELKVFAT